MATIKSFTDIEQSKKLTEILPIESADMDYIPVVNIDGEYSINVNIWNNDHVIDEGWIPCWSLAALLDVLNKTAYFMDEDGSVNLSSYKTIEWDLGISNSDLELITESNPVDACYEMILKLHE